jgi:Fic family protein
MRAGRFVRQLQGYTAFEPAPLPPDPPVRLDGRLALLHADATTALGRLDGVIGILPNPDLFVAMYVRQEAVLSSQIEGTQASLTDVLQFEAGGDDGGSKDVAEVVNYVRAMNYGLERLSALPLSLRLIKEIHAELMRGVRGQEREPGEFRRSQNWIGSAGCTLDDAMFVPPPPHLLLNVLGDLERFLHDGSLPPLIHAGLAHAQFETIHPFLDGNGRIGRLLVTFLLTKRRVLSKPLLYVSHYLKRHRAEYYDRLQAVRVEGAWEGWIEFFLGGVLEVATQAHETARQILALQKQFRERLSREAKGGVNLIRAFDLLFEHPIVTARLLETRLAITYATANNLIGRLGKLGIVVEQTGFRRNRRYSFVPYLELFTPANQHSDSDAASLAVTEPVT